MAFRSWILCKNSLCSLYRRRVPIRLQFSLQLILDQVNNFQMISIILKKSILEKTCKNMSFKNKTFLIMKLECNVSLFYNLFMQANKKVTLKKHLLFACRMANFLMNHCQGSSLTNPILLITF